MAKIIIANNAEAELDADITDSTTDIELSGLSSNMEDALGLISSNTQAILTIANSDESKHEIILGTEWDSDALTLTCTRGHGGTTARSWESGDRIEIRVTDILLNSLPIGTGDNSIALPRGDAEATHSGAIALGTASSATDSSAIAIGEESEASDGSAIGIGPWAIASNSYAIAIGYEADALGNSGIAIGSDAESREGATYGIAIGPSATVAIDVSYGIAIGGGSGANADYAVIVGGGSGAVEDAENTVVVGAYATGNGPDSVIIGYGAGDVSAGKCVALGKDATASAGYSTAIGEGAEASQKGVAHFTAIQYQPNINAAPTLSSDDILTRHRAAPLMTLASGELDLTDDTDEQQIEIPEGTHFFPDSIDVIIISASSADGTPEIQVGSLLVDKFELYLGDATGGTFDLGKDGDMKTLNYDDSASTIESALEDIYGSGEVTVESDSDFKITFTKSVGDSELTADFSDLSDATDPELTETETYNGGDVDDILAASALSETTVRNRERFSPTLHGKNNINIATATAGSGTWTCRVVVTGYLIEDE